jgi:putative methyltransferase (TIGR04325 family)
MKHAYCTYFDHNYLSRALLMLRSLRAFDAESTIFVLALSDLCQAALKRVALPKVEVIALAELERAYPELLAVKLDRTPIEYIFTLTPTLPLYVFGAAQVERVTYVDADLYFFSSPQPVLDATAQASVAITPHNFSPSMRDKIVYGRFNVGWMSFRRSPEGLACLEAYKMNCLAWCYDRLEDGLFADQRYLDTWPESYPGLAIIAHKGVNTGPWNADNYRFTERGGQFFADGDPLVCYHFSSIRIEPNGSFEGPIPEGHRVTESLLVRRIIRPYVAHLLRERVELHRRFPALAAAEYASLRYHVPAPRPAGPPWRFVGRNWPDTKTDTIVSNATIGDAITLYFKLEASGARDPDPLFGQIIGRVAEGRRKISVLDWYGGVGQNYFTAKASAPKMEFDWHVFEMPAYCDYGKALNAPVRFHETTAPPNWRRYDLVLVRGTLGLDPDWRRTFINLSRATEHALVLSPVLVHQSGTFVAAKHPPEWRNGAGVNAWIVSEQDLQAAAAEAGLAIVGQVPGPLIADFKEMPGQVTARVMVLTRRR